MIFLTIFSLLQVALSFNINIYTKSDFKYVGSINSDSDKCVSVNGRGFKYSNGVFSGYLTTDCSSVCRQSFTFDSFGISTPVRVCDGEITYQAAKEEIHACRGNNQWKVRGRCFTVFSSEVTWSDALMTCHRYGLGLATLRDTADNFDLKKRITSEVFIGLNDRFTEGKWTWASGSSSLRMWKVWGSSSTNEPNGGRTENCAVVIPSWGGLWNDASCDLQRAFVCSVDSPTEITKPHPYCSQNNQFAYNGKCFTILPTDLSWDASTNECNKRGMTMATIRGSDEQNGIVSINQFPRLWLGLSDKTGQWNWQWSDGITSYNTNYKNWNAGEPNGKNSEHCVEIASDWSWKWNDRDCSSTGINGICQVDINKLPSTSQWIVNGRTFYHFSSPRSWREAKSICESNGFTLATLRDETDNNLLAYQIKDTENKKSVWIGLNNLDNKANFQWVSGSESYRNWENGEPSNSGGNENCVEIYSYDGKMNDLSCEEYLPFVCYSDNI